MRSRTGLVLPGERRGEDGDSGGGGHEDAEGDIGAAAGGAARQQEEGGDESTSDGDRDGGGNGWPAYRDAHERRELDIAKAERLLAVERPTERIEKQEEPAAEPACEQERWQRGAVQERGGAEDQSNGREYREVIDQPVLQVYDKGESERGEGDNAERNE